MMGHIAVLGAGNGAHAFAGELALRGHTVRLYNKFAHEISDLQAAQGVTLTGAIEGFGPLDQVTTDIGPVISGADLILVVVPATAHAFMAQACAPYLSEGQTILLNPGRTGGALEFASELRRANVKARVFVAEAQTLLFTCRLAGPAQVNITSIKREVPISALPARDTPHVLDQLNKFHTQFTAASNCLETGLDNIGAIFHPSTVILSAARIEAGPPFEFYQDITPSVAGFLQVLDDERLAVARAWGVPALSAGEWLVRSYSGITGDTLYERIHSNAAYRGIPAPRTLDTRYVWEDIPTGLVPLVTLGKIAGVEMPTAWGIIQVANALCDRDFWIEGRNAERLGIAGLSMDQVKTLITGTPAPSHADGLPGRLDSLPITETAQS